MTANENESLTAERREQGKESEMAGPISITLTANDNGDGTISVTGPNGGANLPVNSGATRFNFSLVDNTTFHVRFSSLDAEDNSTDCPPSPGENSQQITGVVINAQSASFTDNNSNLASNGPLSISYAWNFACDPGRTVGQYDPIITNGGKTGPL